MEKLFENGLGEIGIILTEEQKNQFVKYYELLIKWNKVMNLTGITNYNEVLQKHFIDSLCIVKAEKLTDSIKIIDMGSGAGFPGLPIKIAFPNIKVILFDSLKKRVGFLNEVIAELNLHDVKAVHGRAEEYGKNNEYREKFDYCVSRAVARLTTLSEYCIPYVKPGGYFISYKSGKIEEELNESKRAIHILGGKIDKIETFNLPHSDIERSLVCIKKISKTPEKYPRSQGKPAKEPI